MDIESTRSNIKMERKISNTLTKNNTIKEFCNKLGCKAPTPGGGSVAALQGALACGLIAMVADLTLGKAKYNEYEELNAQVFDTATKCKEKFLELADADIAAYSQMRGVMTLPKNTEEEKKIRSQKMRQVLKECAQPPISTMRLAAKSLCLIEQIFGKSNIMAQSDLGCAATLLVSTMQNAWLNVIANTNYMGPEQDEIKRSLEDEGQIILVENKQKAEQFYSACC